MSISPASRKAKGRRLQNWVAKKVSELLNIPCGRDEDIQGREMGQAGTDIKLYGKAAKLFPFSVECKSQETWAVPAWVRQAKENENEGTNWLLICKKNREKPIVVMDAEVFFKLYKKIIKEK
jgi:hypothetical protein